MKTPIALSVACFSVVAAFACTPPAAPGEPAPSSAPTPAAEPAAAQAAAAEPASPSGQGVEMPAVAPSPSAGDGAAAAPPTGDALAAVPPTGDAPPSGVRSLSGTRWTEAAPGGQFQELVFTDAFVFFRLQDGTSVTLPVDYTGAHPACLGYPSCLLTIDGNQQAVPFFLGMQEDVIFFVDCTFEGAPGPEGTPVTVAGLAEELGTAVVHQSPTTICWNPGRIPFRQAPR